MLMENVPDMALDKDMLILRTMVDELEDMGYGVEERLVATSEYGVPQLRHRLILVATRRRGRSSNGRSSSPRSTSEERHRRPSGGRGRMAAGQRRRPGRPRRVRMDRIRIAEDRVPEADAAPRVPRAHRAGSTTTSRGPSVRTTPLHSRMMDSDTLYSDLDDELKRYRDDIFDDKYKRLDWNKLSRTITAHIAKDGYWYIHPEFDRTLTVREAARIQTFPDHVRFAGAPSSAFRQIGNAVPPLLGEQLGEVDPRIDGSSGEREPLSTAETAAVLADWFCSTSSRSACPG